MSTPRPEPYMWITWLSKLMTGEISCEWQTWFKTHFTGYDKVPSDFDLAKWTVEHNMLLRELRLDLQKEAQYTYLEAQNQFRYQHALGAVISGKPDLIMHGKDKSITVYDAKTGQQRGSDNIQVMLYMNFLPKCHDRYKGETLEGCVVYNLQNRVKIQAAAVDKKFIDNVDYFARIITAEEPPLKNPSKQDCKFCDIPKSECLERFE